MTANKACKIVKAVNDTEKTYFLRTLNNGKTTKHALEVEIYFCC